MLKVWTVSGDKAMWKRLSGVGLVVAAGMVCVGCRVSGFSLSVHDHDARPVRVKRVHVPRAHICTHDCHAHYWDGAKVIVLAEHRHGHDCGHHWDGSHWIVRKGRVKRAHGSPKVYRVAHEHSPSCGHVYNRRAHKWIKVRKGHVHRHGCGHVHLNGRWSIRIR